LKKTLPVWVIDLSIEDLRENRLEHPVDVEGVIARDRRGARH
jgi:hypothetical protein